MKEAAPGRSPPSRGAFRRNSGRSRTRQSSGCLSLHDPKSGDFGYDAGMARQESDREDLLREATALVERAELQVAGEREPVTVGFRRDGSLSVFFGSDPVYQFNSAGELRRAFVAGLLYKAERGHLVELRRERSANEVALVRRNLTEQETASFLSAARLRLTYLHTSLAAGAFQVIGRVPADFDVAGRVCEWLLKHLASLAIASRPHVG